MLKASASKGFYFSGLLNTFSVNVSTFNSQGFKLKLYSGVWHWMYNLRFWGWFVAIGGYAAMRGYVVLGGYVATGAM